MSSTKFAPSIFDDFADDFFINIGMQELTEIGNKIKNTNHQDEIIELKAIRKLKSFALQQQLYKASLIVKAITLKCQLDNHRDTYFQEIALQQVKPRPK